MLIQNHCFSNGKRSSRGDEKLKTRGVGGTGGLDVAKANGKTMARPLLIVPILSRPARGGELNGSASAADSKDGVGIMCRCSELENVSQKSRMSVRVRGCQSEVEKSARGQ